MLISLIGYRGTGKTTVGSLLAERLGFTCLDSDVQIAHDTGVSIRQIFESEGEEGFRNREAQVVADLTRKFRVVLALGGGAILREENRRAISVAGPVIWLTASAEELHRRISQDPASEGMRPNLADGGLKEVKDILEDRTPLYQTCSDLKIETENKPPREIVDEIIARLDLTPETDIS